MPNEKEREVKEILKKLRAEGWSEQTGKGSHKLFKRDGVTISLPTLRKVLKQGTYHSIAKLAGWL